MEEIFNVRYNEKVDKLEIARKGALRKIFKFVHMHKLISTAFISFFIFSGINFYLIYSFMRILENI